MQSNRSYAARSTTIGSGRSQAHTSTTTLTYILPTQRRLVFASDWHFLPEGVKDVKQRFDQVLHEIGLDAYHSFNEKDSTFRLKVLVGDVNNIRRLFQEIINDIIREETGVNDEVESNISDDDYMEDEDEEEEFSSNKIQEVSKWRLENRPAQELQENAEVEALVDIPEEEIFPHSVRYFKSRVVWPCLDENLERVVSDETVNELKHLTGCEFEKDLNSCKLYIGAHNEEACHRAISKLDIIRKYFKSQRRGTPFHVFYSEQDEDVKYNIKAFVHVKPKYFETTLLDNLHVAFYGDVSDYNTLKDAYTIRCAIYDTLKSEYKGVARPNIKPIVMFAERDIPLKDWSGFKYSARGNLLVPLLPTDSERISEIYDAEFPETLTVETRQITSSNMSAIKKWANQVPEIETQAQRQAGGNSQAPSRPRPAWDKYQEYDPSKYSEQLVIQKRLDLQKSRLQSNDLVNSLQAIGVPQPLQPVLQPGRVAAPVVQRLSENDFPKLPAPRHGKPQVGQKASTQGTYPRVPRTIARGSQESSPQAASQSIQVKQRPVQQAPVQQPQVANSSAPNLSSTTNLNRQRVTDPEFDEDGDPLDLFLNRGGLTLLDDNDNLSMLELQAPLEPIRMGNDSTANESQEQIQETSELSTRIFHSTMGQRAGAKKKQHNPYPNRLEQPEALSVVQREAVEAQRGPDPLPEFLENVNVKFEEIMTELRGFRGRIDVQAEFGRILLRRFATKQVASKGHDHPHDAKFIIDELLMKPNSYGPTVFFTNVLSTISTDLQYLIDMKDTNGNSMWERKALSWSVKYIYTFINANAITKAPFIVEIDAETFVMEVYARRVLGSIYVHGTRRHWDFRISATGCQKNRELEEKHRELATAISTSLTIPPNETNASLTWVLPSALKDQYSLEDLSVRRVLRYKSNDCRSLLNITEVQSLDIFERLDVESDMFTYRAIPGSPYRSPNDKLSSWFEASITCAQATKVLEHNTNLELGEEANWTPEALSRSGAMEALVLPAVEMLKNMDAVGFHNNNEVDIKEHVPSAAGFHDGSQETEPVVQWW